MNTQKIVAGLLLLFGLALIIAGFIHFGQNLDTNILVLGIVVSTIIYSLYFFDFLVPWVDLSDQRQKRIGAIGLRWFFTFFYSILAITGLIVLNISFPMSFVGQLIIHGGLFFILLMGLLMSYISAEKVGAVHDYEQHNSNMLEEIKNATNEVKQQIMLKNDVPSNISSKINLMIDNLRYLSPSNTAEAQLLERNFLTKMKLIRNYLMDEPLNHDKIHEAIRSCEIIYSELKNSYSN